MNNETSTKEPQADDTASATTAEPTDAATSEQSPVDMTVQDETLAEIAAYQTVIAQLESDLAEERARANDLLEKSQRMAAEFQNSRRRQEKQVAEEIERASGYLIKRLLPVVDDFDLAFANVPSNLDAEATWVEGFRQIQKKLHALLDEEGVVMMPRDGEFDPALHEAIMSEPSDTVPSGYIIDTLRSGHIYKDRVLRPALVRVAL